MSNINRRQWMQKSLLTSTLLAMGCRTTFDSTTEAKPIITQPNSPIQHPILPLHWNENPYGPSEKAVQAVTEAMKMANRYPDDMVVELQNLLAKKFSVNPENVFLTAGSTEVLGLVGQQVGIDKGEILFPWPTFPTMAMVGEMAGATIRKVPLDKAERIDLDVVLNAISPKTNVVFICNPNNPTGLELDTADLNAFCRAVPSNVMIFIDEAYMEYANNGKAGSMIPLVNELPNLMICRTFSKAYGLAGLRLGYAISNKKNIDKLRRRHTGEGLAAGWPPLVAAKATLQDSKFIPHCIQKNQEGREIIYQAFDKWGVSYNPSSTNFVYAKSKHFVPDVKAQLKIKNILISKWPGLMDNHIRISISTPAHIRQFVETVEQFLA